MLHQDQFKEFTRTQLPPFIALNDEPGLGKTKQFIDYLNHLHDINKIDAVVIFTLNNLLTNIIMEFEKHGKESNKVGAWRSTMLKKEGQRIDYLMLAREELTVLVMPISAFAFKRALPVLQKFVKAHGRVAAWIDEVHAIKSKDAQCTKAILKTRNMFPYRFVTTGTPVLNDPMDVWSAFAFMEPRVLGDYYALATKLRVYLPPHHPVVIKAARNCRFPPKIQARDKYGRKLFHPGSLDWLRDKIAPHVIRRTKDECLDLPEKIFVERTCNASDAYIETKQNIDPDANALVRLVELRQAAGKEKIGLLQEVMEEIPVDRKVIIWASFVDEVKAILEVTEGARGYFGETSQKERDEIVQAFQHGDLRVMVATQATAGTGLTLTACQDVIYYSHSYKLGDYLQSQDRTHRIGMRGAVTYFDLIAESTTDRLVLLALRAKEDVASYLQRANAL